MYRRFTETLRNEPQPVPPYSVIVYKKEGNVIAEDYEGNIIDIGTSNVDDDNVIQAAIDALPTSGGKVIMLDGNFQAANNIVITKDNVTLSGSGMGTKITVTNEGGYGILVSNKDNVTISDLHIDMNGIAAHGIKFEGATCTGCSVVGVKISNSPPAGTISVGIGFGDAEDIFVGDCEFYNLHDYAVAADSCSRVIISNCRSYNGIGVLALNGGTHGIIIGCTIEISEQDSVGIKFSGSGKCAAVGNYLISSTKTNTTGISFGGNEEHYVVANNVVHGFTQGICPNNHAHFGVIVGNNVDDCTTGILSSNGAEYSIVNNNILTNCDIGVDFSNYYGEICYNKIQDCTIGINLQDYSRDGNVIGNQIEGVQQEGIKVYDSTGVYEQNISNNVILNASQEGNGLYSGILLGGFYHCVVGNIISCRTANRVKYGIEEQSSCVYVNNVVRNIVVNAATGGIYAQGIESILYEPHSDLFMDVLAEDDDYVHAAITGTGAEQEVTTGITNPDVPRNVSITTTNVASPSGDVVIEGVDAKGNSATDTITIVAGGTAYGAVPFSTVSKITIPETVTASDTVSVGIGSKLGLSNVIYETGDVYKVKKNNADVSIGTVDVTNGTVDCSTITGGDDFTIYYRSNLNIIT